MNRVQWDGKMEYDRIDRYNIVARNRHRTVTTAEYEYYVW